MNRNGLYMYHFEVYSSKTLHSSISRQIEIYHKLTCNIFIGHKGYDLYQCYKNSGSSHYRHAIDVSTHSLLVSVVIVFWLIKQKFAYMYMNLIQYSPYVSRGHIECAVESWISRERRISFHILRGYWVMYFVHVKRANYRIVSLHFVI